MLLAKCLLAFESCEICDSAATHSLAHCANSCVHKLRMNHTYTQRNSYTYVEITWRVCVPVCVRAYGLHIAKQLVCVCVCVCVIRVSSSVSVLSRFSLTMLLCCCCCTLCFCRVACSVAILKNLKRSIRLRKRNFFQLVRIWTIRANQNICESSYGWYPLVCMWRAMRITQIT